jgi:hypothetical protein
VGEVVKVLAANKHLKKQRKEGKFKICVTVFRKRNEGLHTLKAILACDMDKYRMQYVCSCVKCKSGTGKYSNPL